ncbi:MAG TPA: thioredoxin-dependent thiol peroxidase [Candidatus Limnocylindrales bacterium]|nr:thioredoxin-dependent thiol peroxidase [Candidatus Limnocylindrales bacterium]
MTDQMTTPQPAVGDLAPDFTLPDDTGTPRRLAEQYGKWVILYFYPTDDTPGCTTEACAFRDANDQIEERNAAVWGVSHLGVDSKAAFKAKYGLPFVLLADEDHAVADSYGVWVEKNNYGKKYMGIARATFLVDPDGKIARTWPKVRSEGHAEEVLAALDEERTARSELQTA